jgi:hypothetical protein
MVTALCRSDTTLSSELLHFADTVDKLDTPEKVLAAINSKRCTVETQPNRNSQCVQARCLGPLPSQAEASCTFPPVHLMASALPPR